MRNCLIFCLLACWCLALANSAPLPDDDGPGENAGKDQNDDGSEPTSQSGPDNNMGDPNKGAPSTGGTDGENDDSSKDKKPEDKNDGNDKSGGDGGDTGNNDNNGDSTGSLVKREKQNEKDCKYNDKKVEHGKQAYEDVCGKLECRDGNLAWYFWPNADYFEECHVPPPLSHSHRQHGADIPVHGSLHHTHAVGLPVHHAGLPFNHGHDDHLHLAQPHHAAVPVNVHIDHVHHPEEHHFEHHPVVDHHPIIDHAHHGDAHHGGYDIWPGHDPHTHGTHGGVAGSWGSEHGHAPYGYGF